ncbi:MAG: Pectate trisaccharide-lyase precursor [Bacteroidetes bacterium ADurb.BinA395]|nr:MAG: Pectate trisaccharide-lyase precursor [Bacteroidetes bacterium ADurb.BinA395]
MNKTVILFLHLMFFFSLSAYSQSIDIFEANGWLESACLKWHSSGPVDSYNVYYTGGGITNKKIDSPLIRKYADYWRADIVGLAEGEYSFTVKPVVNGTEAEGASVSAIMVKAHDRSGFAFQGSRVPGAYKSDGTLKDNAVILYITESNKNSVSMTVTGATTNPCVGLQSILDGFKKGKDTRPLSVRLIGQITDLDYMLNGDIVIENNNNASSYITFEGIGDDAVADGWGLRIKNASNIEVRNLGFMNCDSEEGDDVSLQQNNDYIWVHNCDFFYGAAGSDADQIKGDGALDCKKSTYVTFSYNHFWDCGKCNLLGLSEGTTSGLYITYHHNWYDHSDSRHPRVRYYSTHVYNNYYDGNAKYGVGSTTGASVFVEGNYFRNCKYPMLISKQGTDIYQSSGTFSGEDGGIIKAFNNYMTGQNRFVAYGSSDFANSTVDFDAYVVASRSETVPSTVKTKQGSNTYNNFDTDASVMYQYTADTPEQAKEKVMQYAGRVNGGDLKWTFNNAVDDASYDVNTGLKAALTNYSTSLVAVQGESSSSGSSQTLTVTGDVNQTVTSGNAISNIVFTWGGEATDASVNGLPASGIDYIKDAAAKTITISGTPTATVSYTVTTSGQSGTPVSISGTIIVTSGSGSSGAMIHNFTTDGKTSSFYSITGNLSTSYGTVTYQGLTLTQCLKMESSTNISFTTTSEATLTLVFNPDYTGTVKIDGTTYTPSSTNGIVTISSLPAGSHTIVKGSGSSYLFYMSTVYNSISGISNTNQSTSIQLYPNPVSNLLNINSNEKVTKIEIFSISGQIITQLNGNSSSIDLSNLSSGNYLIKIHTQNGVLTKLIVKK